jgi:hypothetical protein
MWTCSNGCWLCPAPVSDGIDGCHQAAQGPTRLLLKCWDGEGKGRTFNTHAPCQAALLSSTHTRIYGMRSSCTCTSVDECGACTSITWGRLACEFGDLEDGEVWVAGCGVVWGCVTLVQVVHTSVLPSRTCVACDQLGVQCPVG